VRIWGEIQRCCDLCRRFRQPGCRNEQNAKTIGARTRSDQKTEISIVEALHEWTPLLRPNYHK
jgi:hypothetical protein